MPTVPRWPDVLLVVALVAVSAAVVQPFVRYVDHYPYMAVDDSLANVSYSLATYGRFGYPISPIQGFTFIPRHKGFFNYGPWYFVAGAALIWLFGFSVPLLRSLHLLGIIGIAAIACLWFGRRGLLGSGAVVALGLLYSFDVSQWPMVRPDIAVSFFAVLFIVAAGNAIEKGSATAWFTAGLAAGCAATSHLVAWTLVPASMLTCAIALATERPSRKQMVARALALFVGLLLAALMFYGSFGFRIRDHLSLLRAYGQYLDGEQAVAPGYGSILATHLRVAFWYLSRASQVALGCGVAASFVMVALGCRRSAADRREVLVILLPPVTVLVLYLASLTFYPSYHTGYAILTQVAAWWCVAGAIALTLRRFTDIRWLPSGAAIVLAGVCCLVLYLRSGPSERLRLAHDWVSITDYTERVGDLLRPNATAWGSTTVWSDRVQFVNLDEALSIVEQAKQFARDDPAITPDYVVWGYPNNRDQTLRTLHRAPDITKRIRVGSVFGRIQQDLSSVQYRLIGLIAAVPYGVTRVYSAVPRADSSPPALPVVSVFDVQSQQWQRRLEGPIPASFTQTDPATFAIDFKTSPPVHADRTVVAHAPAGRYLLRVQLGKSSDASDITVLGVTSTAAFSQVISELGPDVDFSPYGRDNLDAYLIHEHPGGPLYVSQFDDGVGAAIGDVEIYRIQPSLADSQQPSGTFRRMPPFTSWTTGPSVSGGGVGAAILDGDGVVVDGDASTQGYQFKSPPVNAIAGDQVTVKMEFSQERGNVCVGALNANGKKWLANGGKPPQDFAFSVDDSQAFILVFYNCNPPESASLPSRFRAAGVRYAVKPSGFYVDRLMTLLERRRMEVRPPRVLTFPDSLVVSATELARPIVLFPTSDFSFRAAIAAPRGDGAWIIRGKAEGQFSYVLRAKPQAITDARRLIVTGRVEAGGFTVGLLKDNRWAGQVAVTTAGDFVVIVEPPADGTYEALVANNLADSSLDTDIVIHKFGWLR